MPEDVAREFGAVPLQFDGNVLAVAFAEPPSVEDVDALAARVGHRINPVLADPVVIAEMLHIPVENRIEPRGPRSGTHTGSPLVGPDPEPG